MDETTLTTADTTEQTESTDQLDDMLTDELLVEEISIDGMCGVY